MKKILLKILAIALFFSFIGLLITFPYELLYKGDEDIILYEDSFEMNSFEELIDREEFKNKILYIKFWEPFDTETRPLSEAMKNDIRKAELAAQTDSSEVLPVQYDADRNLYAAVSNGQMLEYANRVYKKYKDSDMLMVYLIDADTDNSYRKDNLRKWKYSIKHYQLPGYYMVLNPELTHNIQEQLGEMGYNLYLPFYWIVNRQGEIVSYEAPWPQDDALLNPILDSLLTIKTY